MEDEAKELLILKIMAKVYEISTKTNHDILATYCGSVNTLDLQISKNGRKYGEEKEYKQVWLNEETTLDELKKVLEGLKEYEKGEEQCQED